MKLATAALQPAAPLGQHASAVGTYVDGYHPFGKEHLFRDHKVYWQRHRDALLNSSV
ncbi:MAG: hypothetical protein WB543_03950 [Candidatus Acidiferrum sp.]